MPVRKIGFELSATSGCWSGYHFGQVVGKKQYEITNHLGNVLATVSDRRLSKDVYSYTTSGSGNYKYDAVRNMCYAVTAGTGTHNRVTSSSDNKTDWYTADVISYSDYYAYGEQQHGRFGGQYRFGFNGMEKVDEVHNNSGDFYAADYRSYDTRLGRWLSQDPIVKPWESPYAAFSNNPIYFVDPSGLDPTGWIKGVDGNIRWDANIKSQADVQSGEKYLGETVEIGFTRGFKRYNFSGDSNGNYSIYHYDDFIVCSDTKPSRADASTGGPAWARNVIINYGNCARFGQWGYTSPSANTISQPTLYTNTYNVGATYGIGLGTQYRTWSIDAPGYLYDETSFSTFSFGASGGGASAGGMVYFGVGGMGGVGIWDKPSNIILLSNAYSFSVGGTFIGGNFEAAPGQGYWLVEGGLGYNVGIKSGYGSNRFIDSFENNPFSMGGGGTWLVSSEAPRTREDTMKVLLANPNASDSISRTRRIQYGLAK